MAISARLDELKKKFDENPRRYFAPLANEYRKQGDTTQAIALCRTHLPNQPGHISGHIVLAQALYECRELAESRLIFEAALELDPENIIALRYLGDIAREQGSPAAAQAWYRRVLEFDPRNEEIAQLLADVREDAAVELADIASRPTPAAGAESSFQPEDTALAQQEPIETAMPDQEAVAPSAATASLEIQATESTQTPTIASFEPEATASIELEAAAGASEIAEEPLDLYDADPTGDAWRESIAEEAGPATRLPGQAAELASAAEHVPDIKEIKATNEPSFDDWFAQPAAQDVAASQEPALEEFAPDLAAAAPAEESRAAADAIEEFTWSFTDTARVPEPNRPEQEPPIEANSQEEPEIEFSPWGAPSASTAETSPTLHADGRRNDEEWKAQSLPSIDDSEDRASEQAGVPDEPAAAQWNQPPRVESAHDADIEAAFDDGEIEEPSIELTAHPSSEPEGEVLFWAEASTSAVEDADIESDGADVIPDIASLDAGLNDGSELEADQQGSDADEAMAASMSTSDPMIGRTPSFVPVVSEESSAAFVTETMAELYLQQGFHEEALSIYRQLLARNPQDRSLVERVRALEQGAASAVVNDDVMAAHPSPHSESARAFFARFASRGPARGGREGNGLDQRAEAAPAATVPLGGAAMPDEALTRPDEPTLTNIFADQRVPAGDAQAAKTLASAFGAIPGSVPARSGELSLQQLFRDVPARSSGAVTLGEQGTGSSQGSSGASASSDPHAEAPADYEQFTAWLEGLKKK